MSYRAFKRLLGETSLERKCRFLFGAATLLLITASFWWHARQTEDLAFEQIERTGRLLVNPLVRKQHDKLWLAAVERGAAVPPRGDMAQGQTSRYTAKDLRRLHHA